MIVPRISASHLLENSSSTKIASLVGGIVLIKSSDDLVDKLIAAPQVFQNNLIDLWIDAGNVGIDKIIALLDKGASKIILEKPLDGIPSDRLVLKANVAYDTPCFAWIVKETPSQEWLKKHAVRVLIDEKTVDGDSVKALASNGCDIILDIQNDNVEEIGRLFASGLKTDRPDGLFTTVVVDEHGVCLGLVYSSVESIVESIKLGQGVYQSRNRGLWQKGLTSGATQTLLKMDYDCDQDALRFVVHQNGAGFCHLNTRTCFGSDRGITALNQLLIERKASAPHGSYTARLFNDKELLHNKIMEEAGELCEAEKPDDVAWEAADLIYFALTKCVSAGVNLVDIERHLDARGKKITRRPGNAKPNVNGVATKPVEKVEKPVEKVTDSASFELASYDLSAIDQPKRNALLQRPVLDTNAIMDRVKPIVDSVRQRGDAAIRELTAKFDNVQLDDVVLLPPFKVELDESAKKAIDVAYDNIYRFHEAQLDTKTLVVETMPGVVCSRFPRAIDRVGLYIPGGSAVLPSTALMLGVPAKVVGCQKIVFATPPRKDGTICPEVLYVANKVGAHAIVKAGGAQAVAALAYGTESVPKVDKIFGPGNQFVTAAKLLTQNDFAALVACDLPAGPSEVLIVCDKGADASFVASDVLSQAEHGPDSQSVLVTIGMTDEEIQKIQKEVDDQANKLPRSDILRKSIVHSYVVKASTMDQALDFVNDYAPEHLILYFDGADAAVGKIRNAGSIFVGPWAPVACGDYASGTNHTLPTYGYAKCHSGVNTATFLKHITSQTLTKQGLNNVGPSVMRLAEAEQLDAHRQSVAIRLEK